MGRNIFWITPIIAGLVFINLFYWTTFSEKPEFHTRAEVRSKTQKRGCVEIHVLAWNRPKSLERLLASLNKTDFGGDFVNLTIHIDGDSATGSKDKKLLQTYAAAYLYDWVHGAKTIVKSEVNKGLGQSWFQAWTPKSDSDRAVIFEDDTMVSPLWYKWLCEAWRHYFNVSDMASICLHRQRVINSDPIRFGEINDVNELFLYEWTGSYGISPHPVHWRKFTNWIQSVNILKENLVVLGVGTTNWWQRWNEEDRRQFWSHPYFYFCHQNSLYTLYANLHDNQTFVAHMRESGMHLSITQGQDFPLATNVLFNFPATLSRYNCQGELMKHSSHKKAS